jgi:hypothetical protein
MAATESVPPPPSRLIVERLAGWPERLGLFAATLGVYCFFQNVLNPLIRKALWSRLPALAAGPRLFVGHLVMYSLSTAAACAAFHVVLVRARRLQPFEWHDPPRALRIGLVGGLAITAATAGLWAAMRGPFFLDINFWKIAGNLFSNFYEEII